MCKIHCLDYWKYSVSINALAEQSKIKQWDKRDRKIFLKISAWILFWFGVANELLIILESLNDVSLYGYSSVLTPFPSEQLALNTANLIYNAFGHFMHIVAGFWLAKGTKKGIVFAISLSLYEIIPFLTPMELSELTSIGYLIRILFGAIILLTILGRKELKRLGYENWRPWHNAKTLRY